MPEQLPTLEIQTCRLGAIFALGIESGYLEDALQGSVTIRGAGFRAKEGGLHGRRIVIIRAGAGRANAAKATETLIDGHRPDFVLSAGFAGGLSPTLKRHDLLLLTEVTLESGESISISPLPLVERPGMSAENEKLMNSTKLLTTDRIVRSSQEKASLHEKTGAIAVDMETFAVAEVCRRRSVPFIAVRIIHDTAQETLPPELEKLRRPPETPLQDQRPLGSQGKRPRRLQKTRRFHCRFGKKTLNMNIQRGE
jgi:adenosylhomocysteine nucleosidase